MFEAVRLALGKGSVAWSPSSRSFGALSLQPFSVDLTEEVVIFLSYQPMFGIQ